MRGGASKPAPKKTTAGSKHATRAVRPIEFYFWPTPNGFKIAIMLEECGLSYDLRPVNIARGEQFAPEFLKISSNNRIPAIVDPDGPDGKALAVFESGAILQYLGRKSGKFYPETGAARADVEQWLYWQVSGLGPMAGQAAHFRKFAPETIPYAIERYTAETARLYGVMNRRLADREYLAGKYSIADMACYPWIAASAQQGQNIDAFAHVKKWMERVGARPAVQRAMQLGRDMRGPQQDLRSSQDARRMMLNPKPRG